MSRGNNELNLPFRGNQTSNIKKFSFDRDCYCMPRVTVTLQTTHKSCRATAILIHSFAKSVRLKGASCCAGESWNYHLKPATTDSKIMENWRQFCWNPLSFLYPTSIFYSSRVTKNGVSQLNLGQTAFNRIFSIFDAIQDLTKRASHQFFLLDSHI